MVIHTKKKPKLHLHTGKKSVVRKKAGNTSVTVKRRKSHSGIRERLTESGKSVKVRNQSLKTMAAAGIRAGAGQVEGGEEIKESLDLAAHVFREPLQPLPNPRPALLFALMMVIVIREKGRK